MSTQKQIVRKVKELSTRSLFDLSSKVKAAGLAALGTDLISAGAYLHGDIGAKELLGTLLVTAVPVIAAYAKRSSEEILEAADEAAEVVRTAGPVLAAVVPQAAPVVEVVEDAVATVQEMLDEAPVAPVAVEVQSTVAPVEATPVVPATTNTIVLTAGAR
jgi:hypothetical protein